MGLCRSLGVPTFWIGLIAIPLVSALPLLFVSAQALVHGASDAALGTIFGACILDILLVLGAVAAIRTLPASAKLAVRDGGTLVASSATVFLLARSIGLGRGAGAILLAGLAFWLVLAFATDLRRARPAAPSQNRGPAPRPRRAAT